MSRSVAAGTVARRQAALLPATPGVYRFRDARGRVLYIGRAVDLRRRVQSYWGDAAVERGLRRMVAAAARVEAIPCDSAHEAAWLERNLLMRRRPPWNRALGGAEVPVWITVAVDARRPGVRVVHEHELPRTGAVFGPYLGGNRVRLALAALHRALPLAWTGTGITASERAMGAQLGVGPEQHRRLLACVLAVVGRDPAAVAAVEAELAARRDAAAERLDFETAAAIRDELDALTWIVAPQRVTVPGTIDLELAAFGDGRLVTLSIHGGQMDAWGTHVMSARAAERHVAVTSSEWRTFVQRAADLDARLSAVPGL